EVVQLPDTVIIDELFVEALGVERLGDEVEIFGTRARVGGISRGIRTITAAPFIFTSLETAQKYDHRSSTDDVTYVLIRCQPGVSPATVRDDIMRHVPAVEALTSLEFALRSIRYWMLETGLGITVVLTATLGVAVGAVIISQTLFAITNDYLREYATLLAVGFSRWQLVRIVFSQATVIGLLGIGCGSIAFSYAIHATSRTPIPLETTPWVFLGICVLTLACCLLASVLSIRSILRVDPITVFHS
ncbi:MAG: ABC transporter permease, partial [Thermomicrobiales bacterium]